MNRVWTEEEIEILRRDREAKVPVPVTAAKLGRPVPATYARARLIGTLVQPHQSWDDTSVARLRELVLTDPPMTDKRIAAELGRTVTQIRWKMQDLGLIGVRDLSKLAKAASASSRPKAAAKPEVPKRPVQKAAPAQPKAAVPAVAPTPVAVPTSQSASVQIDPRAALNRTLKQLEDGLKERLKTMVAESEAGMVRAAMDAIAEKNRIDRELAERYRPAPKAEATAEAPKAKPAADAKPIASAPKPTAAPKPKAEKPKAEKPKAAASKPALSKPLPAASRPALAPAPSAPAPVAPKIVVMEAPAAIRNVEPEQAQAQTSGRGGWKSVRKDPARIAAQAKAKATNRADAVDLAQAAQAAIERFIAERGVTRTEANGTQTLISRLQARGYIVVRDENGWMIDQRHHVESEAALAAFAEARGISLNIAA